MNSNRPTGAKPPPEPTHSWEALADWEPRGVELAVLGFPISHSLSPAMHNAALAWLVRSNPEFADWHYTRFEVPPEHLSEALVALHRKKFRGVNLTVPHKVLAVELVSAVSEEGGRLGAVNTLKWHPDGYHGTNTDGYGLKHALERDLGAVLVGTPVLLLGAGGASRAAAQLCLREGCSRLWLANRSPERLQELLETLPEPEGSGSLWAGGLADEELDHLPPGGILINATSCGLKPEDPSPFDVKRLPPGWRVFDMIYRVGETSLVREARGRGLSAADGLSMLVYQGARSLEIWTGVDAPVEVMWQAAWEGLHHA